MINSEPTTLIETLHKEANSNFGRAEECCIASTLGLGAQIVACSKIAVVMPAALTAVSLGGLVIPVALLSLGLYYYSEGSAAEQMAESLKN